MRYLKITLSGTALFLLYLWVSVLLNSCNNNKPSSDNMGEEIELLDDEIDYTDDEFEGEDDETMDESKPSSDSDSSSEEDYNEDDGYEAGDYTAAPEKTTLEPKKRTTKTFTATSSSAKTNSNSQTSSNSYGNSSGEFMVIAGSYLLEDNAKNMIRKLQNMGYANAEIVYFNQSQYHSICAGRYDSRSTAKQTASSLRSQGIDTYVHRKQQ